MANESPLSSSDVRDISAALIEWLNTSCPELVDTGKRIEFQRLGETSGLSLHVLKGTVKRREYIDGGYDGFYPFAIYSRGLADCTANSLLIPQLIDLVGNWLDTTDDFPDIGSRRYITSIKQVTTSTIAKRFDNGVEDYMATFELYYEKE